MKILYRILVLIFCIVFVAGCASRRFKGREYSRIEKNAPGWIDGTARDFPPEKHFVGVGVSGTSGGMDRKIQSSKDAARAEIAKIFKVKIETMSEETMNSTMTGSGKYSNPQIQETYSSFVRSSTDMVLEGVEIKDSYKNKRGEVYTLAVISKGKALDIFTDKINGELAAIKKEVNEASRAVSQKKPLLAIKFNRRALLSSLKIELLNAQILVSGGNAIKISPEHASGFIKIKIDRLFSSVSVAIEGEKSTIKSHILEVLTGLGLRIKKGAGDTDFLIKYNYTTYDDGSIALSGDYVSYKARSNLSFEFFKRGSQKVVGKANLESRGVGKTADLASKHAVKKLSDTIREELERAIFRFL